METIPQQNSSNKKEERKIFFLGFLKILTESQQLKDDNEMGQ